jgi:putative salt-induced outer membrane protein YdiY
MFHISILKKTITATLLFSCFSQAQNFSHSTNSQYFEKPDGDSKLYVSNLSASSLYASNGTSASPEDILTSIESIPTEDFVEESNFFDLSYTGAAEFGFLYKSGNSQTGDMKGAIDFRIEEGQWLSLLNFDLLIKKADVEDSITGEKHFETTEEKWSIVSQTNYTLNEGENHYIYGNIFLEDNTESTYSEQKSISAGWGKYWYKTAVASFWADIGPGYKTDILRETDTQPSRTENTWIVQAQAVYLRKLSEFVEFKQFLSSKYAIAQGQNSILKAESTVTTKLISTLQLRFTFTVDYNSEVEVDKKHTDTQTAVTLVYSF